MRIEKLLLILSILIMTLTITTEVHANDAIIDSDQVNIRTGPGTEFEIIKQAHTDEIYPILQVQGEWIEIQLTDISGWIISDYITILEESEVINDNDNDDVKEYNPNVVKDLSIIIQSDNTHIRNGPSTDHEIIHFANKGTEFEVVSEDVNWYEVVIDDTTGYLFKSLVTKHQSVSSNNLSNKTIVIDAGHGGRDVGAIGANGAFEKDITAKTAYELKQTLTTLGAEVILTRTNDEYTRLASRPTLANLHDTDAFISIHYNSYFESPSVMGIDTYYYADYNKQLANTIQKEIINETDANDRGIGFGDFQVLRQSFQPAVLLELGFMSNSDKEQLLLTNTYQKKLVKGITNGLLKYFGN